MAPIFGRLAVVVHLSAILFTGSNAQFIPSPETTAIPAPSSNISAQDVMMQKLHQARPPTLDFSSKKPVIGEIESMLNMTITESSNANAGPSKRGRYDARQNQMRVMIVGDSMSQGQQGDFTWRYRISQWFSQNSISVDFVGPYHGTVTSTQTDPGPPTPPRLDSLGPAPDSGGSFDGPYAHGADFDSDHFAAWGRAVHTDKSKIYDVLQDHPADMILFMLGFNDVGWWYSDWAGTLDSTATFISEARRANPNMKFAIANIPHRLFINGRQDLVDNTNTYNAQLPGMIAQWTTPQSPISLVHLQENYQCDLNDCPAGYDGLHPNEMGEYQIAHAFSASLYNDFQMGSGPLQIPSNIPPREMTGVVPPNFNAFSSPQGATAEWSAVFGAYSYDTQNTITLADGTPIAWNWSPQSVSANRWDTVWAQDGLIFTLQVRARAGNRVGPWTNSVQITSHPQLAGGPQNILAFPTDTGVDLYWDPPTGPYNDVVEYGVIYYDIDSCDYMNQKTFLSSPAHIDGMKPGHHQFMALVTWNSNGEGLPSTIGSFMAGSYLPGVPQAPAVNIFNAWSVQLTWPEVSGAAGYAIWIRDLTDPNSVSTRSPWTVGVGCTNIYWLTHGAWNYEFCISAFNGAYESEKSGCTVAPETNQVTPEPTCPAGPQWCSAPPSSSGSSSASTSGSGSSTTTTGAYKKDSSQPTNQPAPSNNPNIEDGYSTADWYQYKCTDPSVVDTTQDPAYRWAAVKTDSAWASFLIAWTTYRDQPNSVEPMSDYLSNFFHGPPGMSCADNENQNNCGQTQDCTSIAAAYNIINSVIQASQVLINLNSGIQSTKADIGARATTFGKTFATFDDAQEKALGLFIDLLSFGFIAGVAPIWAYGLKASAWGKANGRAVDTIKDETNNFGTGILRVAKDLLPSGGSQSSIDTEIENFAANIVDHWANITDSYQQYLFGGSDQSLKDLYGLIRDGKFLDRSLNNYKNFRSTNTINHALRRNLWLQMLPAAWSWGSAQQSAVILNSGKPCGTQNPLHGDIDDKVAAKNFACVNNVIYYLVSPQAAVYANGCNGNDPERICSYSPFVALNGADQLTPGNTNWEGITVNDVITAAVNTWTAAGNKNGAPLPDVSNNNTLTQLQNPDSLTPGLVTIPVCGVDEARNNWVAGNKGLANYPCN